MRTQFMQWVNWVNLGSIKPVLDHRQGLILPNLGWITGMVEVYPHPMAAEVTQWEFEAWTRSPAGLCTPVTWAESPAWSKFASILWKRP